MSPPDYPRPVSAVQEPGTRTDQATSDEESTAEDSYDDLDERSTDSDEDLSTVSEDIVNDGQSAIDALALRQQAFDTALRNAFTRYHWELEERPQPPPRSIDHYPPLQRREGHLSSIEEMRSFESLHSAAFTQAQDAARLSRCIGFFEDTPWRTKFPKLRPEHVYGTNSSGRPSHGRLSPFLYLCNDECDYGLCAATFGTMERCPLGLRCRWKHAIKWNDLKFLITSGRLSLDLARVMLANWQTPTKPEMRLRAEAHMMNITVRLAPLENAQILSSTGPYVATADDADRMEENRFN
ncbi:hypothetical protein J4E81_003509 [Alternaria sp. BMP 2799]|nr:hypothetical protein J4E81_003509 [Alternaria sp. BMP 2799]